MLEEEKQAVTGDVLKDKLVTTKVVSTEQHEGIQNKNKVKEKRMQMDAGEAKQYVTTTTV